MNDITKERDSERDVYKKNLKDDQDAIGILEKAQGALEKFYRDTSALQVAPKNVKLVAAAPEPHTNFQDGDYKGSTGEARGVLSIIEMLKEDIRKQIKTEGQDEIDAQNAYEKDFNALTQNYRASEKAKLKAEDELADLKSDKTGQTENKAAAQNDLDDEKKLTKALATDCDWVADQFEKRRSARKAELDGLNEAKDFLAGAGTAND